jgi:hypothetical protein
MVRTTTHLRSVGHNQESQMSIFGSIMNKIFHHGSAASPAAGAAPGGTTAASGQKVASAASPSGAAGSTAGAGGQNVDVEAVLSGMSSKAGQQLDWRHSIVDLMKLLNLESSLSARKELAQELHYTGDMNDSASMNMWLHKQVMQKLAENGGKVPDSLRT